MNTRGVSINAVATLRMRVEDGLARHILTIDIHLCDY